MPDVVGATRRGDLVLAASLEAMAVLDGEHHRSVNRQYADTFGFERAAELEGTPWDERFEEGSRMRLEREALPMCRETGQWRGEVTGRRRDGSRLELDLKITELDGGEYVACLRDLQVDGRAAAGAAAHHLNRPRRRGEGAPMDRLERLVLELTRAVIESESTRGIEETVCEGIAAADLYRVAWICGPDADGDRLLPRVVAGIDQDEVESTLSRAAVDGGDGVDAEAGPAVRAFRSGEPVVCRDVQGDPAFETWRSVAADHDVRSAAVVPIESREGIRGCLAVATTRRRAFRRREREALETLARVVGSALDAVANRELLYGDTVVELEFELTDRDLVFVQVSDDLDCELTVTGCVEAEVGSWSVYVSVDGADPAAVRDAAAAAPGVEVAHVIAEEDDGGSLELVMNGPAMTELASCGAIVTSARAANGQGQFSIEVPQSTDVRRMRDRLRAAYPDSSLVAQREHERPARTAREVRQSLADRLTDRQREALERAAHAGYFEWPRTSTAGDVADSMAVSETTFHYHLRNGLDTLLGELTDLDGR